MNPKENPHAMLKGVNEEPTAMSITRHLITRGIFALLVSSLLALAPASAQLVADGQTNVLDGVTNTITGRVTVGTNGSFTGLFLSNGALLTNTLDGVIGLNIDANSNYVWLTGAGTRWFVGTNVYVGVHGAFNQLVVSNGGTVLSVFSAIGFGSSASNNVATVTGAGSRWSNSSSLVVGGDVSTSGNQLVVNNGGAMANSTGYIGYYAGASNNAVTVTGTNSLWSNGSVYVGGVSGSGNQLVVSNGGTVQSAVGFIGYMPSANNNVATVTGAGSVWSNGNTINVGFNGSGNILLITAGGWVANSTGFIGRNSGANNNRATVSGFNSVWTNSANLFVGVSDSFNTLLITNGGRVANDSGFVGWDPGVSNNQVTVTGADSTWANIGELYVGYSGSGTKLLIANGGRVANTTGYIGSNSNTSNNVVTVTGIDSLWSNSLVIYVGYFGSSNSLLISNGGKVKASAAYVGSKSISRGNLLSVSNGTLTLTNTVGPGALDVGYGTAVFTGGTITTDLLVLTNSAGTFAFNSGALNVRTTLVANAQPFIIGNGTSNATFNAVGGDTHSFADGLLIQSNATLTGTGTINGSVTNCGTIFLTNADQMTFTGPVVNKGVILAVTGTPRFNGGFTNLGTLITTASINVSDLTVSGADLVLQFNTVSNYLHEVQARTNVSSGVWQSLTNGLPGTGSPMTYTDPGGALASNRTYRVLLH